jgi:parallel beta-helix repeat protein
VLFTHNAQGNYSQYRRGSGLYLFYSRNGVLVNSACKFNAAYGIRLFNSVNNTVKNNNCVANTESGIILDYSTDNTLDNNSCSMNNYGIDASFLSHRNRMINNHCNNNGIGIHFYASTNNTLLYNSCSGNDVGIKIYDMSDNVTLVENNCSGNIDGISVTYKYNKIMNNTCLYNSNNGIYLDGSKNNLIVGNNCSKNLKYGIYLVTSNGNQIMRNNIYNNTKHGIYLWSTDHNRIHYNNLINNNGAINTYNINHIQGRDDTSKNFWNTSTEGNYWSDWIYPDNDSNGIVDFPYVLDGNANAKDFYPLINKVVVPDPSPLSLVMITVILLASFIVHTRAFREDFVEIRPSVRLWRIAVGGRWCEGRGRRRRGSRRMDAPR